MARNVNKLVYETTAALRVARETALTVSGKVEMSEDARDLEVVILKIAHRPVTNPDAQLGVIDYQDTLACVRTASVPRFRVTIGQRWYLDVANELQVSGSFDLRYNFETLELAMNAWRAFGNE